MLAALNPGALTLRQAEPGGLSFQPRRVSVSTWVRVTSLLQARTSQPELQPASIRRGIKLPRCSGPEPKAVKTVKEKEKGHSPQKSGAPAQPCWQCDTLIRFCHKGLSMVCFSSLRVREAVSQHRHPVTEHKISRASFTQSQSSVGLRAQQRPPPRAPRGAGRRRRRGRART